jgi:tetratricopeptide (TPR) repeat protein
MPGVIPRFEKGDAWPGQVLGCLSDPAGNPTESLSDFYKAIALSLQNKSPEAGGDASGMMDQVYNSVNEKFSAKDWQGTCVAAREFWRLAAESGLASEAESVVSNTEQKAGISGVLVCWLLSAAELQETAQAEEVLEYLLEQDNPCGLAGMALQKLAARGRGSLAACLSSRIHRQYPEWDWPEPFIRELIGLYRRQLDSSGPNAQLLCELGYLHGAIAEWQQALECYSLARELAPGNQLIQRNLERLRARS